MLRPHVTNPTADTPNPPTLPRLVLGSTSPYRRELLARLGLPFDTLAPQTDESPLPGEAPRALAARLARAKAEAVAAWCTRRDANDDVVVIGSDQVADLGGQALGKPGNHAGAVAQLRAMRGRVVHFHTAVCVLRPRTAQVEEAMSSVAVAFRALSDADIETYLQLEQPYDCAGSAKCEGLGIALLERIDSDDPTALIGLPLMTTRRMLAAVGLDVLAALRVQGTPTPPQTDLRHG